MVIKNLLKNELFSLLEILKLVQIEPADTISATLSFLFYIEDLES